MLSWRSKSEDQEIVEKLDIDNKSSKRAQLMMYDRNSDQKQQNLKNSSDEESEVLSHSSLDSSLNKIQRKFTKDYNKRRLSMLLK